MEDTVKLIRATIIEAAQQRIPSPPLASDAATERVSLSPAVLGANLLNAARVDYRCSSPVRMARKQNHGRLSHVGAHTEPRRMDLARPRENVWDLPESPEGRSFKLPERVNHAPLKKRKKPNAAPVPLVLSSPPRADPQPEHQSEVQIVKHLSNGALRCAATSYRCDKAAGPRHEQCHNAGTHDTPQGSRCTRHARKPGPVRCEHVIHNDDGSVQCTAAGVNTTTSCAKHMKTLESGQSAGKKKPRTRDAGADESPESPKRTKKNTVPKSPAEAPRSSVDEDLVHSIEDAAASQTNESSHARPQSALPNGKLKPVGQTGSLTASKSTRSRTSSGQDEHKDEDHDDDTGELGQRDAAVIDTSDEDKNTYGPFKRVFEFLDLERRPGRCQTRLCLDIKSACDGMRTRLLKDSPSLEDAAENLREIQNLLLGICRVGEENRRAVKGDMHGHVFRSLTRLLRSLYSHLDAEFDDIMASSECTRMLSHLVHDILATKGWIADWKIRWNSDRMIKDVDSFLIAPLRDVETFLNKHLRKLEKGVQDRRALLDLQNQHDEEDEAERVRLQEARNKRYDLWLQLHIARMDVEPDPYRRRTILWVTKLEELEEMDANGVIFERLPVFKNRRTPPLRKTPSAMDATPWSTAQETAIIDGLQDFAGQFVEVLQGSHMLTVHVGPNVFHDIFRKYCRPGGLLRDFSVRDIVAKAEWIRSLYTKHYQEKGGDEPDWMQQNPTFF